MARLDEGVKLDFENEANKDLAENDASEQDPLHVFAFNFVKLPI
jgi:hypothetical protein